jgi:hypothetical protein
MPAPPPTPGWRPWTVDSRSPRTGIGPPSPPNWPRLRRAVRAEKLGEVAAEFDGIHDIHRAVEVGSVDEVIAAADLRPRVIAALDAG